MPVPVLLIIMLRANFSVKDSTKWLSNHGLSVSGSKQELENRIRLYQRYPNLVKKLAKKAKYNRSFHCSLDESLIPPLTAPWTADAQSWPDVSNQVFLKYCGHKREGNAGQQAKAVRMLESRKVVSVKSLFDEDHGLFVRALINPSFGNNSRPAVLLFLNQVPSWH